jgi:chromate transporter
MLLQLFISFFKVGSLSFGGGLAALPLIQEEIVIKHAWLSMYEFTDLISIAEMTPGPIAVNSATFVGIRLAGFPGALVATFGCISPSIIIVTILAYLYFRFRDLSIIQSVLKSLRPAVVALIASAGISILKLVAFNQDQLNYIGIIIFVVALVILRKFKLSPILVMFMSGLIGGTMYYII